MSGDHGQNHPQRTSRLSAAQQQQQQMLAQQQMIAQQQQQQMLAMHNHNTFDMGNIHNAHMQQVANMHQMMASMSGMPTMGSFSSTSFNTSSSLVGHPHVQQHHQVVNSSVGPGGNVQTFTQTRRVYSNGGEARQEETSEQVFQQDGKVLHRQREEGVREFNDGRLAYEEHKQMRMGGPQGRIAQVGHPVVHGHYDHLVRGAGDVYVSGDEELGHVGQGSSTSMTRVNNGNNGNNGAVSLHQPHSRIVREEVKRSADGTGEMRRGTMNVDVQGATQEVEYTHYKRDLRRPNGSGPNVVEVASDDDDDDVIFVEQRTSSGRANYPSAVEED